MVSAANIGNVWIGYYDAIYGARDFSWADGTCPDSYIDWSEGEPNNQGDEGCVVMYQNNGLWNDWSCWG
jgi:hypothetical protein